MRRLIATLVALGIAIALVTACGNNGDEPTPTPAANVQETEEPTPIPKATIVDVEVKDGKVVGGMKRWKVPLGQDVRIQVRSDVADEVHVHGYDKKVDIAKGGGVNVPVFTADVPGVFIVELESLGLHIAELEVR